MKIAVLIVLGFIYAPADVKIAWIKKDCITPIGRFTVQLYDHEKYTEIGKAIQRWDYESRSPDKYVLLEPIYRKIGNIKKIYEKALGILQSQNISILFNNCTECWHSESSTYIIPTINIFYTVPGIIANYLLDSSTKNYRAICKEASMRIDLIYTLKACQQLLETLTDLEGCLSPIVQEIIAEFGADYAKNDPSRKRIYLLEKVIEKINSLNLQKS